MYLASAPSQRTQSSVRWVRISRDFVMLPLLPPGWVCVRRSRSAEERFSTLELRPVRNRVALALRLGANSLHHADNYLGNFFRRMKRKIDRPPAVTATAHKLARIIFHFCRAKKNTATVSSSMWRKKLLFGWQLHSKQAATLGFQIVPVSSANV